MIYIDPPYNTGNKDFIYNDSFVGSDDIYRHSKWLSFMDRRLRLARTLLKPDGFMAVSIDDNEYPRLRLLLEKHFGEGNVRTVAVKMSEASGLKMASIRRYGGIAKYKEYLLVASATSQARIRLPDVPKAKWPSNYNRVLHGIDQDEMQFLLELEGRSDDEAKATTEEEIARADSILSGVTHKTLTASFTEAGLTAPRGGTLTADEKAELEARQTTWKQDNAWRIVRGAPAPSLTEPANKKRASGHDHTFIAVRTATGLTRFMMGADQLLVAATKLELHPGDFWADIKTTGLMSEGGVSFKNGKKPLALLRRIIGAHPNRDAVVLDFFAGSASSAHAVAEINAADGGNRQSISITSDEADICMGIALPRMRGILTGNLGNGKTMDPLPGALRVFRCSEVIADGTRDARFRRIAQSATGLVAVREGAYDVMAEDREHVQLASATKDVHVWLGWDPLGFLDHAPQARPDATSHVLYAFGLDDTPDPDLSAAPELAGWRIECLPFGVVAAWERAQRISTP